MKIVFTDDENLYVIAKGKTSNKKITDGKHLVQTYTFSLEQWHLANTSKGFGMKAFFALDSSNCLDCPFSGNGGKGGCYTHKFNQYVGFLSMLRSIKEEELTPLTQIKRTAIIAMSANTYIRFGSYGEPSLLPIRLVQGMSRVASSWTGYTHQHSKPFAQEFSKYFMASTHSDTEALQRSVDGWRSFIALPKGSDANAVSCPASAEAGFKSNCAKCGLCSGTLGKGRKSVKILEH